MASSALLLVVVSALIAFNAWPGGDPIGGLKGLVVDNHEPSLELTGPARVAADAAPAAAAVAAAPPAGTAAPAARAPGPGGLATPVPRSGGSSPGGGASQPQSTTQAPSGRHSGGPAVGLPSTPSAPDVQGVAHGVGGGVEQVTGGTGKAVGVVSPDVGKGMTDTGKALSEIVQGIGPGAQKQLSPPKLP